MEEGEVDLVFDDEEGDVGGAALVVDDVDEHGFDAAGAEGEEGVEDGHLGGGVFGCTVSFGWFPFSLFPFRVNDFFRYLPQQPIGGENGCNA